MLTSAGHSLLFDSRLSVCRATVCVPCSAFLPGGEAKRPEPVLVVEEARKPEPRTQMDLLAVGKEFGLDGKAVGAALKKAGISEFNPERWDEMVTAVQGYKPE